MRLHDSIPNPRPGDESGKKHKFVLVKGNVDLMHTANYVGIENGLATFCTTCCKDTIITGANNVVVSNKLPNPHGGNRDLNLCQGIDPRIQD